MKMTKAMLAASVLCSLMSGTAAYAEEATAEFSLDPMVVTASRIEQTKFDAQANIDVITREEIENRHYNDLGDALKDVPGVNLHNYGASGENYTSNRLYINGSQRIVVLIDGMRANVNGSSSAVLSPSEYSNLDNIERIEVLKGSASTLYGADAVGGVINIVTRKAAKDGVKTTLGVSGGSFDNQFYRFSNRGRQGNVYWGVSYQKHKMGDYKDGRGDKVIQKVNSDTYDAQIGAELGKSTLDLKYNKYKSDYTRPKNGGISTPTTIKTLGEKDNDKLSLRWNYKFNDKVDNKLMLYQNNNDLKDNFNNPGSLWLMDLKTVGISDQITWATDNNTMIAGFDFYQDKINKYSSGKNIWNDIEQNNRAVFFQDNLKFGNFNITPGIRYTSTSDYGSKTSKSLSFGYNDDKINVYAGYKEFFYAPVMSYKYYNNPTGKSNLMPEAGRMIEAGINYKADDKTMLNLHGYRTRADNSVAYDYGTTTYVNTGEEATHGWTLGVSRAINDKLKANVAYTSTRITSTGQAQNRNGYIPKGEVKAGIDYSLAKFNANLTARGIIHRPGSATYAAQVPDNMKTFWTADLALNYAPTKNIKTFFRVNNICDKLYTDQMYKAVPDPSSTNWYPAPGRNFVVGVEYSF